MQRGIIWDYLGWDGMGLLIELERCGKICPSPYVRLQEQTLDNSDDGDENARLIYI
jgi:hypothetical protein